MDNWDCVWCRVELIEASQLLGSFDMRLRQVCTCLGPILLRARIDYSFTPIHSAHFYAEGASTCAAAGVTIPQQQC